MLREEFIIFKRGSVASGSIYLRKCVGIGCSNFGKEIPLIIRGNGARLSSMNQNVDYVIS